MTSSASRDPVRDRLRSGILLAVLLHALAFVALEIFLKLAPQRTPEYRGPLIVQLQELPAVQQARQAAPAAVAAAAPAVAAAPQAQLPSGPPLRAAAPTAPAAPGPSGSPFRMEGAPAQTGQPRPAGQGFQVPSPDATLPPAGTKAQGPPLRAVAPGSGGQAAPAAPLEDLDRALASGSATRAGGGTGAGPAAGGAPGGAQSGAGQGAVSQEGISIVFDDPTLGREPTSTPPPKIPKWVSEAGLRLTQEISFVLTPQGVLHSVRTVKSSGHSDVDTAVLAAVRGWKFKPAPASAGNIQGTVVYSIVPTVGPAR
jgi:TonB family protein